jgi:hypothetical protein
VVWTAAGETMRSFLVELSLEGIRNRETGVERR